MNEMEETKVIKITKATDGKLKEIGHFEESYDNVINRIIEDREKCSITPVTEKTVEEKTEVPKEGKLAEASQKEEVEEKETEKTKP